MTDYAYEYGKRWNALLPRRDITTVVRRFHCATPVAEVVAEVERIARASKIPERMISACKRYAELAHGEQAAMYRRVMRGRL
jgi:hypothetical protein